MSFEPFTGPSAETSLQSLMNGFDVLRLLARESNLTLTDVANRLQLNKTVVYRLLCTLQQNGVVSRSVEGKRYSLGVRLWELGAAALFTNQVHVLATQRLMQLAERTHESVNLSVFDGDSGEAVFLEAVRQAPAGLVQAPIAARFPAHCCAAGKVMLAYQAEAEIERYCRDGLVAATSNTIADAGALKDELARVRGQGFAINRGEWHLESCGIAVPLLDRTGRAVAAIGVACTGARFSPAFVERVVEPAMEHAREISRALGYHGLPAAWLALS